MRPNRSCVAAASLAALLVTGCEKGDLADKPRPVVTGAAAGCGRCHAAPGATEFFTTFGASGDPAVGAHGVHLAASMGGEPIGCADCHGALPAEASTPGHMDGAPAEVPFGDRARANGATPVWNRSDRTCSGVYCHGATLSAGGARTQPAWVAEAGEACGGCHGVPPPPPHPAVAGGPAACAGCHPGTVTVAGEIDAAGGQHLDGTLGGGGHPAGWMVTASGEFHGDAAKQGLDACQTCHGVALDGVGGSASAACADCHDGARPGVAWKDDCTMCHGGTGGDTSGAPPEDAAGRTMASATGVGAHRSHVAAGPLAAGFGCSTCHPAVVDAFTEGHVDASPAEVGACAGAACGAALPAGAWSRSAATCSTTWCHARPGAELPAPSWTSGPAMSCTTCHGSPPPVPHPQSTSCGACHAGYSAAAVVAATHVDGSVDAGAPSCAECHGTPPAFPHPASTACAGCHGAGYSSTTVAAGTHVDGAVQRLTTGCTACHGTAGRTAFDPASPPVDAHGRTLASERGVGAHEAHLGGSGSRPVPCAECHAVPAAGDTSHGSDGTPDVAFGALSRTVLPGDARTVTPAWTPASGACASTYCHGNFKNGTPASPTWTSAAATCTSCHGSPPGGTHPRSAACGGCHTGYTASSVAAATHVDGAVDVAALTCSSCHGDAARAAVAGADDEVEAAPPRDASGALTGRAVGAHQAHVNKAAGALARPAACADCHANAVPTSTSHANGAVTVAFGARATAGGATPSFDATAASCAGTYCHAREGAATPSPAWGGAAMTCTSCHGNPPAFPHPASTACASCHGAGYSTTSVAAGTHVDGTVQQRSTGCTACHGTSGRTAFDAASPPVDAHGRTLATERGVGVHEAHLTGSGSKPVACAECHVVPSPGDTAHGADGTPDVAFGALSRTVLPGDARTVAPTFAAATGTCASTYCHGHFKNGGAASPTWTGTAATCTSCHGSPPGGTHPATGAQGCGDCHPGYTTSSASASLHVNGEVDGGGEPTTGGSSCGGCHSRIAAPMADAATPSKHLLRGGDVPDPGTDAWAGAGAALTLKEAPPYGTANCTSMCHGEHPHDAGAVGTHEHNVYADANDRSAARSTATRARTDFDATLASGGLCVSCHQSPIDAGGIAVAKAGYDASAHDYVTRTVGAATYTYQYVMHDGGRFDRNCTKCHADPAGAVVHFSSNPGFLAGTLRPGGAPAGFVCYGCHGNGTVGADASGKDIAAQAAKARAHPVNADAAHDTVAELASAAFGNGLGGAERHASCLDCHDPHRAKAGTRAAGSNRAGPPLEGAWGAQLSSSPAFWTAPASEHFTKKPIVAGTDLEATLCFKCHSSYFWGTGAAPASPSGGFPGTDVAREFNPANSGDWKSTGATTWASGESAGGFHPVLATAGANLGAINVQNLVTASFAWSRAAGTRNLMSCSDCHESDAPADPAGPHGSTASFLLRGPNTTWDATVRTGASIPAGTFCLNCHADTYAASRFPGHTRSNHRGMTCMSCHAAIPHGGPRPGILVAPAGAGAGVGGVIAGWDQTAPYRGVDPRASGKLYLHSYPTQQSTGWVAANCGCDGASH